MLEVGFILERISEDQDSPPDPTREILAKRDLATQLSRLNNLLCSTAAPVETSLRVEADGLFIAVDTEKFRALFDLMTES